jgi:hypothetical protein
LIDGSSKHEICGYCGYHEPPMLLVLVELSMVISPVWLLVAKEMAPPPAKARPGVLNTVAESDDASDA